MFREWAQEADPVKATKREDSHHNCHGVYNNSAGLCHIYPISLLYENVEEGSEHFSNLPCAILYVNSKAEA